MGIMGKRGQPGDGARHHDRAIAVYQCPQIGQQSEPVLVYLGRVLGVSDRHFDRRCYSLMGADLLQVGNHRRGDTENRVGVGRGHPKRHQGGSGNIEFAINVGPGFALGNGGICLGRDTVRVAKVAQL